MQTEAFNRPKFDELLVHAPDRAHESRWLRVGIKVLFAIEDDLLKNPERGDVIQGTHGARKARIGDPDSKRGKRGSYRYIYAYFPGYHHLILLYLFAKNDTADLSAQVKKQLAQLVSQIKGAIK